MLWKDPRYQQKTDSAESPGTGLVLAAAASTQCRAITKLADRLREGKGKNTLSPFSLLSPDKRGLYNE